MTSMSTSAAFSGLRRWSADRALRGRAADLVGEGRPRGGVGGAQRRHLPQTGELMNGRTSRRARYGLYGPCPLIGRDRKKRDL
jgi:hypothetical protein